MKEKKKVAKATQKQSGAEHSIQDAVARFGIEIGGALESLTRAAKIYADTVRQHGAKAEAAFKAAYPNVSETTWDKLRMVGMGDLSVKAMLMSGTMCQRVMRMKKKEQDEFLKDDQGVEVFNEQTRKAEFVKYTDLAPRHERILFDEQGRVRTLEEQRAFVESAPAVPCKRALTAYLIEGDTLVVNRKCRIGKNELQSILRRMN